MILHRALLLGMTLIGSISTVKSSADAMSTSTLSKRMAISLLTVSSLVATVRSAATSEDSTVVTVTDLMTTGLETTVIPTTPEPCPTARWQVQNEEGDICMLMTFNASISIRTDELEQTVPYITETNSVANSICRSGTSSFSVVFAADDDMLWELVLNFTDDEREYIMDEAVVILRNASGDFVTDFHMPGPIFTAPHGMYYTCDTVKIGADESTVTLASPILQPFVHHTPGVCDLGEAYECPQGKSPNVGLIVGCTVGAVACVGTVGAVIFLRRKKKTDYTTF
ncbi:uncharacterized protein [Diadema setosum]|uniref:uncharacterized protein n=1 Tax=Diadema setosum TaxID=31175 RepID=UPI003B3B853C